jgi:predicted anti-sigma-YlaC factor YlaD
MASNPFNLSTTGNQSTGLLVENNQQSVTTTSQATLTFAGAPAAVTLVWKVLSTMIPAIASGTAFPIILSLVVGMVIYASAPQPTETRQKTFNFFFALINSFAIAATTLGISSTLGGTSITPVVNPASPASTTIAPVTNPSSTPPSTK